MVGTRRNRTHHDPHGPGPRRGLPGPVGRSEAAGAAGPRWSSEPDLLLLDEPTNHLDVDAIAWLEDFLLGMGTTLLFVTHDRMFLRRLATRILEIDRGRLFDWSCDYDTFLDARRRSLAAEEKQNALFDKKLAQEEVWIRQGIKARRTATKGACGALAEDAPRASGPA